MRVKEWLIHKLGGYTSKEVFAKAWQVAQTIHVRDVQDIKMGEPPTIAELIDEMNKPDEEDEDMRDCGGCQCWDGDDGICHHPAHLGQVTQNGCDHKEG